MCSSYEPRDNDKQQRQIAEAVLGRRLQYTKSEVAAAAGVELERAEQLWQAMGFAHVDDDEVVFTDADLAALKALVQLVSAEVIQPELENAVARSLAQSMSRLAEWQVGIFRAAGKQFARPHTAQFAGAIPPVIMAAGVRGAATWRPPRPGAAEPETNPNEVAGGRFADIVVHPVDPGLHRARTGPVDRPIEELVNRVIAEPRPDRQNGRRRSAARDRPREEAAEIA